jgi:hypothetical protein
MSKLNVNAQRIKLVRSYFSELETAVKARKKLKSKDILNIFHLLDVALVNNIVTKFEHKALERFINGQVVETYIDESSGESGVNSMQLGYYQLPPEYKINDEHVHFLYPLPKTFINHVVAM